MWRTRSWLTAYSRTLCREFVLLVSSPGRLLSSTASFHPKKAVILAKLTKYQFERSLQQNLSEERAQESMRRKGVNVDWLLARHNAHHEKMLELEHLLKRFGVNVRVVDRVAYTQDVINWADVIFTAGGDGTFLLGASFLRQQDKPLIGINTDPKCSEGHLCLPKWCTWDLERALNLLYSGQFRWFWRQRLRCTLTHAVTSAPRMKTLNSILPAHPAHASPKYFQDVEDPPTCSSEQTAPETEMQTTVLPVCALNEVFIGESLSARVSQYELSINRGPVQRQKSSGITVTTGTGSTSWYYHINRLPLRSVLQVLAAAQQISQRSVEECSLDTDVISGAAAAAGSSSPQFKFLTSDPLLYPRDQQVNPQFINELMVHPSFKQFAEQVTEAYNQSLCFNPQDLRMAFAVRDPLCNAVFHVTEPHGFAMHLKIRSLMLDAHLVLDGGCTFRFNHGSIAEFSIHPDDALRCVKLNEVALS